MVARNLWCSGSYNWIIPVSALILTWCSPSLVYISKFPSPLHYKDTSHSLRDHLNLLGPHLNLVILTQTLFPKKVIFTDTGGKDFNTTFRGTQLNIQQGVAVKGSDKKKIYPHCRQNWEGCTWLVTWHEVTPDGRSGHPLSGKWQSFGSSWWAWNEFKVKVVEEISAQVDLWESSFLCLELMTTNVDIPQRTQKPGKQDEPTSRHQPDYVFNHLSVCGRSHEYNAYGSRDGNYVWAQWFELLLKKQIYLHCILGSLWFS